MRILYIADGRSPIARNWITHFIKPGNQVHLISTSDCTAIPGLASLHIQPVAFSGAGASTAHTIPNQMGRLRRLAPMPLRTFIRQWLGPLTFPRSVGRLRTLIEQIRPDLVHAMRYPYEGIITAMASPNAPLIVSVWGNDFTLHAKANPLIGYLTRRALKKTSALHADCQRDLRLAYELGYAERHPAVVLPGSGGIRREVFFPPTQPRPPAPPLIIQPRGFRTYIRNDSFFQALPLVLQHYPQARFLCPSMEREPQAHRWVEQLGLDRNVELLPLVPHGQMADLFRQAHIVVSPSTHDGTPNTLLEAMACGCFPVAGDIESINEWLQHEENSLLVDPADPQMLAEAILRAIQDHALRQKAEKLNQQIISERANYRSVMAQAETFYSEVVGD